MAVVFLGFGSNMGDRAYNIDKALMMLGEKYIDVLLESSLYETEPWGFISGNMFLNKVVKCSTRLKPGELLTEIKKTEHALGREKKGETYSDRPVDIDILFYDRLVIESSQLVIPHPLIGLRRFVLEPMAEIAPGYRHPVNGKTINEMLDELQLEPGDQV